MSKSRDIADSAATINFIDTVTSNVQDQIDNIDPSPTLEAVASGALANGDLVSVNSDGTVSVVSGSSESIGTPATYESGSSTFGTICYNSSAGKVVIAYRDTADSNQGKAIVGTVSGSSISFGSPAVFDTGNSQAPEIAYDVNANKVVIIYADGNNSYYITAIVGTVSGTSISFGTAVVISSVSSFQNSIVYDPTSQKVIAFYGNSSDTGRAVVGTISGTSISFGSATVFSAATNVAYPSSCYYSSGDKIVVSYSNASLGKARVGTVSGTSISFGSEYTFNAALTAFTSIAYDSTADRILIAYEDDANSDYGTAVVGSISGTAITFGSEFVFASYSTNYATAVYDPLANRTVIAYRDASTTGVKCVSAQITGLNISFNTETTLASVAASYITGTYDATNEKIVFSYVNGTNGNRGDALVYAAPFTNSGSYIGISDGAYSDAATATIQIVGSIDDAQSGLAAGVKYYVQFDGTLSTSPDDPSVLAGTAVSATKLIVKG